MPNRNAMRTIAVCFIAAASIAGCNRDSDSPIGKPDGSSSTSAPSKTTTGKSKPARKHVAKDDPPAKVVTPTHEPVTGTRRWDPKGIQDFQLVERSGRKITRADLLGKPFVASFIFTSCRGPCGKITKEMYELQEWLKARKMDVRLVTLSVDPKRDTPEVLKRYADLMGAEGDRWWFLTGEQPAIYSLIRGSFMETVSEHQGAARLDGFEIAHTTGLMLVDEKGRVIGEYNAQYPQTVNALRKRLSEWKRTGRFPEETPEPNKAGGKEQSSKPSASGGARNER